MTSTSLKIGRFHVLTQRDGTFRVVHTWTGAATGTFTKSADAIRAARKAMEEDHLFRTLGKEDALAVIRYRNGFPK